MSVDRQVREGRSQACARMDVAKDRPSQWRGWRQAVAVRPGGTYLLAAWLKCADLGNGALQVHAHRKQASGKLSAETPFTSLPQSISGTTDWTFVSGTFTMPLDTTVFEIHLTTTATGTVWHDGIVLTEVIASDVAAFQCRPMFDPQPTLWQVPSVVKVFPDDPPAAGNAPVRIASARNEQEVLQLAIRAGRSYEQLSVRAGAPRSVDGKTLPAPTVNVVGYVPIDYPTSYYRSEAPDWQRLVPHSVRYVDGQVQADFSQWDRAAEFHFNVLKLPFAYTPWTFYLFGWGHPAKTFFGQFPYDGQPPFADADRSQLRALYKQAYQACLKVFWEHVKQKGWADRVVLYISDEPHDTHPHIRQQMRALCEMIHEVDPTIPIYSSTWHHVPDWDGYLDIWGIGHDGRVPAEQMAALQAAGDRIWFTTDGQMCTDTPYCAVERLLPHYCFRYGAQAYEFWGVSWLTYDPYRYGWHSYIRQSSEPGQYYWVRYPNGDGFLIYPGFLVGHDGPVSSIRLENAREGVEDYEYLYRLRQLIQENPARRSREDVAAAGSVLEQAAALVAMPNAGGRYSSQILPDPKKLEAVRKRLATAIEAMQAP